MTYKQAQGFGARHDKAPRHLPMSDNGVLLHGLAKVLSPSAQPAAHAQAIRAPSQPVADVEDSENGDAVTSETSSAAQSRTKDVPPEAPTPEAAPTPPEPASAAPAGRRKARGGSGCFGCGDVHVPSGQVPRTESNSTQSSEGGLKRTRSHQRQAAPRGKNTIITKEEVAAHNVPGDAWVIVEGKVYDISNLFDRHPGGASVLEKNAGTDVTVHYNFHQKKYRWDARQIGVLPGQGGGCAIM